MLDDRVRAYAQLHSIVYSRMQEELRRAARNHKGNAIPTDMGDAIKQYKELCDKIEAAQQSLDERYYLLC